MELGEGRGRCLGDLLVLFQSCRAHTDGPHDVGA
jgi:hypothetical protein